MTSRALDVALKLCARFEGFEPEPYLDPVGIPTIGYGTIRYSTGERVTMEDPPISEAKARAEMLHELLEIQPRVLALCPPLIAEPARLGAVLSWTYNLGSGRLRASTMRKRINECAWSDAAREMRRWVFAGGRKLRGLVRRRAAESSILLQGGA